MPLLDSRLMLSPSTAIKTGDSPPAIDPDAQIAALTGLCKASADTLRLLVLRILRKDSFAVSELCAIFDMRQPALSHHLKVLANAGLIAARREGNNMFYRRAELRQSPDLEALQDALFDTVDRIELPVEIALRLRTLHAQREENSRNFFRDNASKFQQQQDLIASYEQYADVVASMLRDAPVPGRGTVLEVGPGDGSFLLELSPQFDKVIALDNAPGMLDQARHKTAAIGLENIEFIVGDTEHARLKDLRTDCVVINMVLHHTPRPGAVLRDVAQTLHPGGVVLVTDLCNHDQGWARENCGDLWLGFDPQELALWAENAGLQTIASEYLAQRNGFQIQVRLFGRN